MRRALAAALLGAPLLASAVDLFGTTVRVRISGDNGEPLPEAFVVAREFATVAKLHGHETYCTRAAVMRAGGAVASLGLPDPGLDRLRGNKAIEAFAYAPGRCAARTGNGRALSYSQAGSWFSGSAPKDGFESGGEPALALRRSAQPPDERLQQLLDLAPELLCERSRWAGGSAAPMDAMAAAMLREAGSLARDRYERSLVARLRQALETARAARDKPIEAPFAFAIGQLSPQTQGFTRDFVVAPANMRIAWPSDGAGLVTRSGGVAVIGGPAIAIAPSRPMPVAPVQAPDASAPRGQDRLEVLQAELPKPADTRLVIHCRHGPASACNLDERDMHGDTALATAVAELRREEVALLLEAGADPSIAGRPFARLPVERLLERLTQMEPGSQQARDAQAILAMLAASPKTRLPAKLREDLMADPSSWSVRQQRGTPLLLAARGALLRLPASPEAAPGCEPIAVRADYARSPYRLRDR